MTTTRIHQREIYYLHPFFKNQQEADEAILGAGGPRAMYPPERLTTDVVTVAFQMQAVSSAFLAVA